MNNLVPNTQQGRLCLQGLLLVGLAVVVAGLPQADYLGLAILLTFLVAWAPGARLVFVLPVALGGALVILLGVGMGVPLHLNPFVWIFSPAIAGGIYMALKRDSV